MKKIFLTLAIIFIIYTLIICFCPIITQWDRNLIIFIQDTLKDIPSWVPLMFDCKLYATSIILPLIIGCIYFYKKYLLIDIILFVTSPLTPFLFNDIFKRIIQRPRPPMEFQMVHPGNFSYVSSHTLISFCLWGLIIYYLCTYCKNKILKITGITISVLWIISVGFSRVWLGVHNPTDVLGAYLLGGIILLTYIQIAKVIGGKYPS